MQITKCASTVLLTLVSLASLGATIAGCSAAPPGEGREGAATTVQDQTAGGAADACGAMAPTPFDSSDVDSFFLDRMNAAGIPGIAVALVGDGKITWTKGYGLANIEENRPATPSTLFMLASVSKTITAVSLMSLLEDPKRGISLDDDVDAQLPFTVRNPSFPDQPITYRMLLTHTSSLIDTDAQLDLVVQGDSPMSLLDFEQQFTQRPDNWSSDAPGAAFSYSNIGAALCGLLAERISGKNLQDYAKGAIFDAIGMSETSYFLRDLDRSHIAMPYEGDQPQGFYGYPDYPDGQIRTSATQLAHFLLMLTGKGQCGNKRVLAADTVAQMETPQVPDIQPGQGLILFHSHVGDRQPIGHNGLDNGVSTEMFFDEDTGKGYVLLTNSDQKDDDDRLNAYYDIGNKLLDLAESLP